MPTYSDATIGYGTTITMNTAAIDGCRKVTAPGLEVSKQEITHLGSPNATREYIFGMNDIQPVTVEFNFTGTNYTTLYGAKRLYKDFVISVPDPLPTGTPTPTTFTFSGFITKLDAPEATPEGVTMFTCEIQPRGEVTIA
jgi:hypothetical protein